MVGKLNQHFMSEIMITVSILINGQPVYTRSAVNVTAGDREINEYKVDDGTIIKHKPKDGAVILAKKMLSTIREE
jgi:hypothetical protein